MSILRSIHGRAIGLGKNNELIVNQQKLGKPTQSHAQVLGRQITTITSAQLLALNATPQTIVTAPGDGKVAVLEKLFIYKAAGTAYAGIAATEDLVPKYTNASGAQCGAAIECTGFLDSAAAQMAYSFGAGTFGTLGTTTAAALGVGGVLSVANAAIVLHLSTGEIITGTSDLIVHAYYDVVDHALLSA